MECYFQLERGKKLFGKVLKQQLKMFNIWWRPLGLIFIAGSLISLTGISILSSNMISINALFSAFFNRFIIWIGYFTIGIGGFLTIEYTRINDGFLGFSKSIIGIQTILQIMIVHLVLGIAWSTMVFIIGFTTDFGWLVLANFNLIFWSIIYVWMAGILLTNFAAWILWIFDNRLIAFLGALGVSTIFFALNVAKKSSFLFYFVNPGGILQLMARILTMIGINLILNVLIVVWINRKEF